MQISANVATNAPVLNVMADEEGPYDLPRRLVLALQGAAEAQQEAVQHLYVTGQVQPGDVIATNFPQPAPQSNGAQGKGRDKQR